MTDEPTSDPAAGEIDPDEETPDEFVSDPIDPLDPDEEDDDD